MSADEGPPPGAACARCGAVPPSSPPPLGWSCGVERDRPHRVCPTCLRDDLRSIEAKLDQAWW